MPISGVPFPIMPRVAELDCVTTRLSIARERARKRGIASSADFHDSYDNREIIDGGKFERFC